MMRYKLALAFLLIALVGRPAGAADTPPYFLSIKNEKTFMREGPGENHRIKWIYHRKGLPVEVIASFEVWRRVRDADGEIGWIHVAVLSRERTAVVTGGGLRSCGRKNRCGRRSQSRSGRPLETLRSARL
jgi:SH3-like domain-containing protein